MLVEHPGLDRTAIARLLAAEYGAEVEPTFASGAGGDSWCYEAGEWWVSIRRDRHGHVPEAYAAACELRDQGLDFVLAPQRGANGAVVHDVRGRPAVVFQRVRGRPRYPDAATPTQAARVRQMVDAVHRHALTTRVPVEEFTMPFALELTDGLDLALAGAEAAGPYGPRVTTLVRANERAIDELRAEWNDVQGVCRADPGTFVLTHGEPDRGNVMVTTDGELLLMDWGELRWGPPERDLVSMPDLGLQPAGRPEFLRCYELLWILGEIAEYVSRFAHPHPGDAEDDQRWDELLLYLTAP